MFQLCKCGCGNKIKKGKVFFHGHNRRGVSFFHSVQTKKKIKEKQEAWRETESYQDFIKRQRKRGKKSKTLFKKGHDIHKKYPNLKKKIEKYQNGELHWNWKGGITPLVMEIRNNEKYRIWRKAVFERDDYTCQLCGERGVFLEADHFPKRFSEIFKEFYIKNLDEALNCEKFWNINNGRTLCRRCHDKTKGRKKKSI